LNEFVIDVWNIVKYITYVLIYYENIYRFSHIDTFIYMSYDTLEPILIKFINLIYYTST